MLKSLWQFFLAGGVFMWPILACSIMAFTLIIYETFYLLRFHRGSESFFRFLRTKGSQGDPAFSGMSREAYAGGAGLAPGGTVLTLAEEQVQMAFDKAGRPLELISGLGGLAPLMGFMGTVSGMIVSFRAIANADKVSVKLVAGGISEALITTGFGLIIAISCTFADSLMRYYLTARAHRSTEELTLASSVAGRVSDAAAKASD